MANIESSKFIFQKMNNIPLKSFSYRHDFWYKTLFSHSIIIENLFELLIDNDVLNRIQIDFSTLKKEPTEYQLKLGDISLEKKADCLWSVKVGKEKLFLYLHFEFQSKNDVDMLERIQIYSALMSIELKHQYHLKQSPLIISFVLYNGASKWTAPITTEEAFCFNDDIIPIFDALNLNIPNNKNVYVFVDESRWNYKNKNITKPLVIKNFCEAIFFYEKCRDWNDFFALDKEMKKILKFNEKTKKIGENDGRIIAFIEHLNKWLYDLRYLYIQKSPSKFNLEMFNLLENYKVEEVSNMFAESMYEGELKKQKEHFLESILFALSVKFDEITDILKQKILSLSPNNFDLQNYKNIIRSSNSAEEAYLKIAKLV